MSRFMLITCLLGLLALGPTVEVLAADIVPVRPVSAQSRVLERLVGTWDTQISGGSANVFSKPTAIGRITRQWVADHKYVEESAGDHEAFFTYDTSLRTYRAWYFHSNGHVWELTGRATARFGVVGVRTTVASVGAFSLSATLDDNQSLTRQFQFLDDKNHQCTIMWTDENGRTGIYGTLTFTRCDPAAPQDAGKNPKPAKPPAPPPVEIKIFADDVGKWALEATTTSGDKTTKASGSCLDQWILGGQFLKTTTTIQGREGENIDITGFDAATKTYRCWHFDTDAVSSGPASGTWDEKERTISWNDQRAPELVVASKKQWINHDTAKIHAVTSRIAGVVESTTDSTLTRQKDK